LQKENIPLVWLAKNKLSILIGVISTDWVAKKKFSPLIGWPKEVFTPDLLAKRSLHS